MKTTLILFLLLGSMFFGANTGLGVRGEGAKWWHVIALMALNMAASLCFAFAAMAVWWWGP